MVSPCTGVYSVLKKKDVLTPAMKRTNREDMIRGEINQSQKGQTLHDSTSMRDLRGVRVRKTESRVVVTRDWGEGHGELFNRCRVSV